MKNVRERFRAGLLMATAASVLLFAGSPKAQDRDHDDHDGQGGRSYLLAVVGDIACQPGPEAAGEASKETCTDPKTPYNGTNNPTVPPTYSLWSSQEYTANQIEAMRPNAVALTGDLQYQVGRYSDFQQSFDLTYGAFKFLHRPAPGNHEFYDEHGETGASGYGYFSYYNGFTVNTGGATPGTPLMVTLSDPCPLNPACGPGTVPADVAPEPIPRPDGQAGHFEESGGLASAVYVNGPSAGAAAPTGVGDGWYSYNLGGWHLVSLNIECSSQPGGCSSTGTAPDNWFARELAWLKRDLEQNHSACTVAYWHQPTFSATNGITPEGIAAQAFWELLYEYRADLVLNGHDHLYAHYRPLDPFGNYDPHRGIREFIVGTGGETLDPIIGTTTASGAGETNLEDPSGNVKFNAENLEAGTGDYWGVMALTLNPNGYQWSFQSNMQGPVNNFQVPAVAPNGFYSDAGSGSCHGSVDR